MQTELVTSPENGARPFFFGRTLTAGKFWLSFTVEKGGRPDPRKERGVRKTRGSRAALPETADREVGLFNIPTGVLYC
ncbi:MAG: hypothetical protein A2Y64_07490 [Candidatus Coatesbacteria bacterium RBG_13_66_14]|uniref:Uncharacterized protein n=1 Tax=Candidatus Coatesbacteria bacterium RBG_13_66_14 TaxID=1817816 RepID=A0A1F5EYD0_9BACT|nr:MAG: hypothetical protein A2Y64_07490 [Candidatus Coatesbacteria bacterium RBG_13_66_14]